MNFNPWNVSSIDEFSYFNCPECTFHAKEKVSFQDHATRNHPLSAVLFSNEVISFLNELNQLKHLSNDQKCKELELKHRLPDDDDIKKEQPEQKISDEIKKDFALPKQIIKIISLQKEKKLERKNKPFHSLKTIPFKDRKSERAKSTSTMEKKKRNQISTKLRNVGNLTEKFEELQTSVNENDPLTEEDGLTDKFKRLKKCEFCNSKFGIQKFLDAHLKKVHKNESKQSRTTTSNESKKVSIMEKGDSTENFVEVQPSVIEIDPLIAEMECDLDITKTKNIKKPQDNQSKELLLTNHATTVHEEKQPYGCDTCKTFFSIKSDLKDHLESVHVEEMNPSEYKILDNQYDSTAQNYASSGHEGGKTGTKFADKKYRCKICDFSTFSTQKQLKDHMALVHENLKPHPCSICDKSFLTKTKWRNHITVVHERKKLFQCSICDYKSGLKQNMKSHFNARHGGLDIEIIYLGDKNHKCYNCDFKTYYKELLYKHMREVHDGKNSVKSFHGRRKEVIMESVRKVCKEGTKTSNVPVQDISKKSVESESVHERKKEEIRKSLRTVRKEGTKTSIVSVQDFSN